MAGRAERSVSTASPCQECLSTKVLYEFFPEGRKWHSSVIWVTATDKCSLAESAPLFRLGCRVAIEAIATDLVGVSLAGGTLGSPG